MARTYLVCLDPGHGPGTVNGSPDGAYLEREFTWDMALRLRRRLEEQGFAVILTRSEDEKPSLTTRALLSDNAGSDLFISIHSNAAGSGWSDPSGLLIYTSAPGDAPRNRAAEDILARMRALGIKLWGSGLAHERFTVLTETAAPALLIEYGFHTNPSDTQLLLAPEYRERLAEGTVQGVCDFFGVTYRSDPAEDNVPDPWAAEAWEKAVALGILDGTAPRGVVTREMLAVVLDRCGLLLGFPAR